MSRVCSCFASDRSECACGAWDEDYQDQLQQAHRAGWEQCRGEAVKAAKYSHHPEGCFCDWCAIAHKASDDVAAMTYKEPTNICLKEIDRLKGELEEYKKICDTWETIDKQSNALLSTAKAALEQEEAHTTELCEELAEARADVDRLIKDTVKIHDEAWELGRQEAAREAVEAIEYEHGILGLAFTLRQRFGLDDE